MKICFVGNLATTFIKRDYDILSKHFDVDVIEPPKTKSGWLKYPSLVRKKVRQCNVVFGWFAGWHTMPAVYYAKKYGKKSIVVVGGYDAAYVPEINYGAFTNLKERIPARYVLKNADLLLPVSKFTKKEILDKVKPKGSIKVVYNGVDTEKFKPSKTKDNVVVTIGNTDKIKLKGLDVFATASNFVPDYKFVIIGKNDEKGVEKLKEFGSNISFTGLIPHNKVAEILSKAKIYCQLSYMESFGMGVAEAMACGCIPVVTNRGAIQEVVGDIGFYVPYGDAEATAEAIKKALDAPEELGKRARERIKEMFSIERREKELVKIIKEIEMGRI